MRWNIKRHAIDQNAVSKFFFWDPRGKYMAKSCFEVQKKTVLETDPRFLAAVSSKMDWNNVDTREV